MKKINTINLSGKEYAQVIERIKEFRQDNPYGKIETTPTIQEDGQVMFRAYVQKDKREDTSADATGHSLGMNKGVKAFEKLETIAVGRALAMLGYSTDGEIASGEEMEEFIAFQEQKKEETNKKAEDKLKAARTLDELVGAWVSLTGEQKQHCATLKNELKAKLTPDTGNEPKQDTKQADAPPQQATAPSEDVSDGEVEELTKDFGGKVETPAAKAMREGMAKAKKSV